MPDQPDPAGEARTTTDHVPTPVETVSLVLAPADTIDQTTLIRVKAPTGPGPPAPPAGSPVIPGYAIEAVIAQGGMGRVYAGRDLTLDRQVAIKTLLPRANAERFVVEAKITARLPHPGIPPVHALGVLADGTPYLAMKLIRGRTLAEMLKERASPQADLSRFVQIFEQIAQAVGFAHAQGIIHRDLKPLNVMVGAFGEVQVMDWGLAKEIAGIARPEREFAAAGTNVQSEDRQQTRAGAVLGTPGYMAPEQARGEAADARADVFSLGSILATVLTGQSAFAGMKPREMVTKAAAGDLSGVLERLATSGADAELIALAKRCLSGNAHNRPTDAQVVATEIAAYRANVEQRLRQAETQAAEALVREAEQRKRRRVVHWAAGILTTVLIAGITGTTLGLFEARKQEAEAGKQTVLAKAETAAKDLALKKEQAALTKEAEERGFAEVIAAFVKDDFLALTSVEGQYRFGGSETEQLSKDTTLRQLLDRAAVKLKDRKGLSPRVEAELNWIIGVNYREQGAAAEAMPFLEKAVALRQSFFGVDHPETLNAMNSLGVTLGGAGRHTEAVTLLEETLQLRKAKLGLEDPDTLATMHNLAGAFNVLRKLDAALPLYEETLKLKKAKLGPNHPSTLSTMNNLADAYEDAGKLNLALPLIKETLKLRKATLGPDHPHTLTSMGSLAICYQAAGQLDLALPLYEESLKLTKAKLGPYHPSTLTSMINLAFGYDAAGKLDLALPIYEETLQLMKAKLGPDHPDTLTCMAHLGSGYADAGKLDLALPLYEETFKLRKAKLGLDHPDTLTSMNNLATGYQAAGKLDLALPLYEETFKLRKAKVGPDHPDTLASMYNLAKGYKAVGQLDLALPLYEETLQLKKVKLGPDHRGTLNIMGDLASAYRAAGKLDLALPLYEETLKLTKAKLGPDHPDTLASMNNLASGYMAVSKLDLALPLYEETLQLMQAKLGTNHPSTLSSMNNLAGAYKAVGKLDLALPLYEETLTVRKAKLGPDHPDTLASMNNLASGYMAVGKLDLALPLYEETLQLMQAKHGPDHPSTLTSMGGLAACYSSMQRGDKSVPLFEHLLKQREAKLGRRHPDTMLTVANLGVTLKDAGELGRAIPLLEEAHSFSLEHPRLRWVSNQLMDGYVKAGESAKTAAALQDFVEKARQIVPKDSPQMGYPLTHFGQILIQKRFFAEAEKLLREAISIREKAEPEAWRTFNTQSALGEALLGQQKYAEAEPLLLKGYEGLKAREKSIPPIYAIRIPEAIDRLIELYTATDKPDEVTKWQAQRAKYTTPSVNQK